MSQLKNDNELAELFLEVLVFVKLPACKIRDVYFTELLSSELRILFFHFLSYLKAPSPKTSQELYSKLDNLIQVAEILHHAGEVNKIDLLHMLKSLLLFKGRMLESKKLLQLADSPAKLKNEAVDQVISVPKQVIPKYAKLNPIKKDLLGIIKNKKEVLNLDLFALMPSLSKRSIKRHLSELIHSGYVSRKSQGKKVYYTAGDSHTTAN